MQETLQQLGINQTVFVQFGLIIILFVLLTKIYFKPFLKLFEQRHNRTIGDTNAAKKLLDEANAKFKEYETKITDARRAAQAEFENNLAEARKEEARLLAAAREEMKKINQQAAQEVQNQRNKIKEELKGELNLLAKSVSNKLISRELS